MTTNAGTNLRDRRQIFLWLFKRRFWKDRKELDNQWGTIGCGNYWSLYYSTKKVDHPPSAIFILHFLKNTRFKNLLRAKSLIFYRKIQPYLQELQASAQTPTWAFSESQLQHTRKKKTTVFPIKWRQCRHFIWGAPQSSEVHFGQSQASNQLSYGLRKD